MKLSCIYIETTKFTEVVNFYEKIFNKKGKVFTKNRWIEFDFGNKLSIYNKLYDIENLNNNQTDNYNEAYIKEFKKIEEKPTNNIITLNFTTLKLKEEYQRIKKLNICDVSEIMSVNITEPYYFFDITDPEGNVIEICSSTF